jgi:hypothetical protein
MLTMPVSRFMLVASFSAVIVGCNTASLKTSTEAYDRAKESVTTNNERTGADKQVREAYAINVEPDSVWVSTDLVRSNNIMPVSLRKKRFSLVRGDSMALKDLSTYMAQVTGVNIRRAPELIEKKTTTNVNGAVDSMTVVQDGSQAGSDGGDNELSPFIPTDLYRPHLLNVTLEEALDSMTQALGIYWRYSRAEGVTLYYFDSKSFVVAESPKSKTINKTSTTGQTGEQTDTGATDNTSALSVTQEINNGHAQ